ncbi:hypothetical protein [Hungatella sp.]|uniref:hypothetical protein n=1 Tax=Hungatella sp. TaxID=2613924 RepID=UPI002A8104D1|nr:hypothetical protein [Hungatella sp.]
MVKVNKKYKDRLFRMVFNRKEELLSLYNAISHSEYTNPEELEINTLDDVIYMKMKNDLAFLIDDVLNLWEHQSTWNPNMPVRGTLYIVEEYRKYIEQNGLNLYGSRLITLPIPQFYVFYNGLKEEPDYIELKPCMEFKAIMMNINRGHNEGLMKQCSTLREYAEFVARIRERTKDGTALGTAVEDVMDSCIRDGVLAEFLSIHRAEVFEVLLTEYDEQRHIADEKELSRREGKEEGMIEKAKEVAVNLFAKGISAEEAASICGEDSSLVAEWHREWEAAK